jgi:hypothetical protein
LLTLSLLDLGRMVWVTRGLIEQHRTSTRLESSDWRWYVIYPFGSTLVVLGAGVALLVGAGSGMYVLAAGAVFHLVVGIHNAWETADYLATLQ